MNFQFAEIKHELEVIKNELLHRLQIDLLTNQYETFSNELSDYDSPNKQKIVIDAIHNDLFDVEVALKKINDGNYGYCEVTGQPIPLNKLRILPTGRTIYDFSFVREHY
ncbi:TraR/DksA C4-type zinc finger protein [Bacillus sp. RG28]|uniref:TraR/DksA C4-type zinc finger protein n=1 Tax=Gottfriedia endophytica TaxID=2820819 RepID=A0A940SK32_9BACI|nr:TraR/DksA C4-type zinc finger protein [Gottfriedia endophytica]MBP0724833.1 TraR/DksA C4-type zinc finger protein [Gottfriedia endophytica]